MTDPPKHVREAAYVLSATQASQLPAPVYSEIAFAGRSNVGKSSLLNMLVGSRKLARTSSTPGCTRAINLFRITLSDGVIDFVDLPGYGYAQRSKSERKGWGPMIEGFLTQRVGLRAIVVIVDIRRGVEEDDRMLLDFVESVGKQAVIVATKLDKLTTSERKPALLRLAKETGLRVVGTSSHTGEGANHLWKEILRQAGIQLKLPA
jgi:GTP-binding protein